LYCRNEGEFAASVTGASVIDTNELDAACDGSIPDVRSDQLAFLQYTSGSTAAPKGVSISHWNLTANEVMIQRAFGHDENTIVCGWLPAFHDMGLVGTVLQPLFIGAHAILMSPLRFLTKPVRWFHVIDEFKVTTTGGPNFCYDHCVNHIEPFDIEELDLSSWKVAFNGAEPVRSETLARFTNKFSSIGFSTRSFFPCYGMAETTLFVTGGPHDLPPRIICMPGDGAQTLSLKKTEHAIVSCGKVSDDFDLLIVDPNSLKPLANHHVGEIWVRGCSVAMSYWRKPPSSSDFAARYLNQEDGAPFFRTGDLGFIDSGELFVTGRLKDLIIIHGRNIYPQDIEVIVENKLASGVGNSAAAFSIWSNGEERLCTVIEASRTLSRSARQGDLSHDDLNELSILLTEVRHDVAARLNVRAEYFAFLPAGEFPRTSSGKVQRSVCKAALENGLLRFLDLPGCIASMPMDRNESDAMKP
jgi:acyl-CoA synthetase (AMP-forming)/AMP-acid ligase II